MVMSKQEKTRVVEFLHVMLTDSACGWSRLRGQVTVIFDPEELALEIGEVAYSTVALPPEYAIRVRRIILTLVDMLEDVAK